MSLAIAPVELPRTSEYPPPSNVRAERNGDQVTILWEAVPIPDPKMIYSESRYFLELRLCRGGEVSDALLGTNELRVTIADEAGCAEPSGEQISTATCEGYSLSTVIP